MLTAEFAMTRRLDISFPPSTVSTPREKNSPSIGARVSCSLDAKDSTGQSRKTSLSRPMFMTTGVGVESIARIFKRPSRSVPVFESGLFHLARVQDRVDTNGNVLANVLLLRGKEHAEFYSHLPHLPSVLPTGVRVSVVEKY